MAIQSREELKNYCLRQLGFPVVKVNVDETQLEDRLDEALQYFAEHHFDGTQHVFNPYQITQNDIDNEYIPVDNELLSVVNIYQPRQGFSGSFFNEEFQMRMTDFLLKSIASPGNELLDFAITESYFNEVLQNVTIPKPFTFNKKMNRIHIITDWDQYSVDEFIIIEGYQILNPDTFTEVYDDSYLKRYATALIKKQWGLNLKKFDGVQLPGNVTLNGQVIYDEAVQEIEALRQEMQDRYEMPPTDLIG